MGRRRDRPHGHQRSLVLRRSAVAQARNGGVVMISFIIMPIVVTYMLLSLPAPRLDDCQIEHARDLDPQLGTEMLKQERCQ